MIFVTVGTDTHDFSRLVAEMDSIARKRRVVMQIGNTRYCPKHAKWFRFETNKKIAELYRRADTIVTHAGAGSIIRSLENNKTPIVVPRLKERREHINHHQLDLARGLGKQRRIILVENTSQLGAALKKPRPPAQRKPALAQYISRYLIAYEKKIS